MKKMAVFIVLLYSVVYSASASSVDLLIGGGFGLKEYVAAFGNRPPENGSVFIRGKYFTDKESEIYIKTSVLAKDPDVPDTALEFAITSYFTATVKDRPVRAIELLPENSKESDLKLSAAVFMEIQILRFLNDTQAVSRHEAVLKFITDRKNVTRAEIETFYKGNIRSLISETADEEFNKIRFLIENRSSTHTATLTRNPQNGQYTLSYGGTYTNEETRTISGNSVDALSREMQNGKYKADFDETGIKAVNDQAKLIPAVYYEKNNLHILDSVKDALWKFYIIPNQENYNVLTSRYSDFRSMEDNARGDQFFRVQRASYENTLKSLNPALAEGVKSAR